MSSGSIVRGDQVSTLMFNKQWNGENGHYNLDGSIKWNPYTMALIDITQKAESCYGRRWLWEFSPYCIAPWQFGWSSNDTITLYKDLYAKARGHSFNLAVAAGESKDLVRMVVGTIGRIRGSIKALKKGNFSQSLRHLGASPQGLKHKSWYADSLNKRGIPELSKRLDSKDVSGLWLEIQYGWRPLIQDVYEAAKAYESLTRAPRRARVTAQQSRSASMAVPYNLVYDEPPGSQWIHFSTESKQTSVRRIYCEFQEQLAVPRSLGLENPVPVIWELVPFSFVADWFIPIGDYLEALNTPPMVNARFMQVGFSIRRGKCVGNPNINYGWPASDIQCDQNDRRDFKGSVTSGVCVNVSRTIPVGLDVPRPSFVPFNEAATGGRIKNAIALLHQVLT